MALLSTHAHAVMTYAHGTAHYQQCSVVKKAFASVCMHMLKTQCQLLLISTISSVTAVVTSARHDNNTDMHEFLLLISNCPSDLCLQKEP